MKALELQMQKIESIVKTLKSGLIIWHSGGLGPTWVKCASSLRIHPHDFADLIDESWRQRGRKVTILTIFVALIINLDDAIPFPTLYDPMIQVSPLPSL